MATKVVWKHGLSFTGKSESGFDIPIGTRVENGGAGDGISPMELLLVGLAGCTGMDVISILEKKRQEVTGFEVSASAKRTETQPRVYSDIAVEYVVTGRGIDPEAVKRAVELSETKYCSVEAMLGKTAHIHSTITIVEG